MNRAFRHRVNCSLSSEQQIQLDRAAKHARISSSVLLRDAAFAYLGGCYLIPPDLRELFASNLQESRRIGTNLNQIAAKANSVQKIAHGDLRQAKRLAQQLEKQIRILDRVIRNLKPDS